MNNFELAAKCKDIALNYKTLYVLGCFGAPMNAANKERYTKNYSYNAGYPRRSMIRAASADTFGFDCVCLIKGILWGWTGNKNDFYGGAEYASGGVPDVGADAMIGMCKGVSKDFTRVEIGEMLWMDAHCAVYIGNGLCVECSPRWGNNVQITAVENIRKNKAYHGRTWIKHGRLPWVKYLPAGDVDFNGKVDTEDARRALRNALGLEQLTDAQMLAADTDGDGKIDTEDARNILRKSLGGTDV